MTETTCPTCGGKCEVSEGRCLRNCDYHCAKLHALNYVALPTPDLTKLREVHDRYNEGGKFMYDNYNIAIDKLWQAVKELLEENKP